MSIATVSPAAAPRPWYREPYVWLVVGGPLVVVVASVITFVVAARGADPVLEHKPTQATTPADLDSMAPAQKARNHVASPAQAQP